MDGGAVRSGAPHDVIGWGYDRCYRPACASAGGQGLALSQLAIHTGRKGGLTHNYGLSRLGARQQRELSAWVRAAHNRSCVGYARLETVPLASAG